MRVAFFAAHSFVEGTDTKLMIPTYLILRCRYPQINISDSSIRTYNAFRIAYAVGDSVFSAQISRTVRGV